VAETPDIPGHRITDIIGTGGFATVYRGWQVPIGRDVAVKVGNRALISERDSGGSSIPGTPARSASTPSGSRISRLMTSVTRPDVARSRVFPLGRIDAIDLA
jgi:serine/threonine protein kinase